MILPRSRNHASLNKSKPNTAETSLLVSIVEAPVYAMKSQYEAFVAHGDRTALSHKQECDIENAQTFGPAFFFLRHVERQSRETSSKVLYCVTRNNWVLRHVVPLDDELFNVILTPTTEDNSEG